MIEIDGKKYLTKEEVQKLHDCFNYLLNFKESMIECYKGQVRILEDLLDKLLLELKEKEAC